MYIAGILISYLDDECFSYFKVQYPGIDFLFTKLFLA